jgi:hypothetical protein
MLLGSCGRSSLWSKGQSARKRSGVSSTRAYSYQKTGGRYGELFGPVRRI